MKEALAKVLAMAEAIKAAGGVEFKAANLWHKKDVPMKRVLRQDFPRHGVHTTTFSLRWCTHQLLSLSHQPIVA